MQLSRALIAASAPVASASWLISGLFGRGVNENDAAALSESTRILQERQRCGGKSCHIWGSCVTLNDEVEECQCLLEMGVIDNPNLAGNMGDQPGVFGCLDVDECTNEAGSTNICAMGAGGFCVDWDPPVKYQCGCLKGYRDVRFDSGFGAVKCADINECQDGVDGSSGISPCSADATCTNTDGDFICTCNAGFAGDGIDCFAVDTPSPAPTEACRTHGDCGSFGTGSFCDTDSGKCVCTSGYFSVNPGFSPCVFRDVCTTSKNPCDTPRATCTANVDSSNFATCKCMAGFETAPGVTDGTSCISSDSCSVPPSCATVADCPARSVCENDQCKCQAGLICLDLEPTDSTATFNCTTEVDLAAVCKEVGASSTCRTLITPAPMPVAAAPVPFDTAAPVPAVVSVPATAAPVATPAPTSVPATLVPVDTTAPIGTVPATATLTPTVVPATPAPIDITDEGSVVAAPVAATAVPVTAAPVENTPQGVQEPPEPLSISISSEFPSRAPIIMVLAESPAPVVIPPSPRPSISPNLVPTVPALTLAPISVPVTPAPIPEGQGLTIFRTAEPTLIASIVIPPSFFVTLSPMTSPAPVATPPLTGGLPPPVVPGGDQIDAGDIDFIDFTEIPAPISAQQPPDTAESPSSAAIPPVPQTGSLPPPVVGGADTIIEAPTASSSADYIYFESPTTIPFLTPPPSTMAPARRVLFDIDEVDAFRDLSIVQNGPKGCLCVECDQDPVCGGLWKGDVPGGHGSIGRSFKSVQVVVSHCLHALEWLEDYLVGLDVSGITIVSKCDKPVKGAPASADIIRLANVGRNDHTYATWMEASSADKMPSDTAVLFLKDDLEHMHQTGSRRPAEEMLRIATVFGFGCGIEPGSTLDGVHSMSVYHERDALRQFDVDEYSLGIGVNANSSDNFNSAYADLGDWISSIGVDLEQTIVPVCYGGVFAVRASQIYEKSRTLWKKIATSLERGNNIEEGHFAERIWATLLSDHLSEAEIVAVVEHCDGVVEDGFSYSGTLAHRLETTSALK